MSSRGSARLRHVPVPPSAPPDKLFLETVQSIRPEDIPQKEADHVAVPSKRKRKQTGGNVIDTIDLHGMTAEQALRYLSDSLAGYRGRNGLVRIIVGKGLHSPDGVGVLRDVVQAWFAHGGRQFVSGWKWAGKKEGGSGVIVARLSVAAGTREQ